MDRDLKERLIGAIVLVGVTVLVVPVFLDGPSAGSEIVSQAVALPGQSQQQTTMQTVVLNRDRQQPVPASEPPSTDKKPDAPTTEAPPANPAAKAEVTPEATTHTAQEVAAASPIADSKPDNAAESATGMWAVQLGSFSNKQNAERLAADLRKQGYAAFLSKLDTDSGALHRVRIGPQKDRDSAESVAARLGKTGHPGQVVPHP